MTIFPCCTRISPDAMNGGSGDLVDAPRENDVHPILVQQRLQCNAHALEFLVVRYVCVVPAQNFAGARYKRERGRMHEI